MCRYLATVTRAHLAADLLSPCASEPMRVALKEMGQGGAGFLVVPGLAYLPTSVGRRICSLRIQTVEAVMAKKKKKVAKKKVKGKPTATDVAREWLLFEIERMTGMRDAARKMAQDRADHINLLLNAKHLVMEPAYMVWLEHMHQQALEWVALLERSVQGLHERLNAK
jgi:hypothetical protein